MYNHEFEELIKGTDVEAMRKELLRRGDVITKMQDELRTFKHNQIKLTSEGYLDFGCANGWSDSPVRELIMDSCSHITDDTSSGNRGFHNTSTCTKCPLPWTFNSDSSD